MIIAIGIPLLFTAFFTLTNLPAWLNFRPFNCTVCLSFWTILFIYAGALVSPVVFEVGTIISYGGIAAYVAMVARRIMVRI